MQHTRKMSKQKDGVTVMIVPRGGADRATRSFHLSRRRWRVIVWSAAAAALLWVGMAVSWWYVASQAARVPALKGEIAQFETERQQIDELAARLVRMEERYNQVRVMLGADRNSGSETSWLPSAVGGREDASPIVDTEGSEPDAWPLTQRGFVTRGHLTDPSTRHPGLDIAVAEGAYIRAAGAGRILEAADDSVYGKFVRIQHSDGYETMYGHASAVFVNAGDMVERHEVIALSGSTGRSTAPHLHFEVRKDGEPIDPRLVVEVPYGS